ncbi:MAG TPA: serine protease [Pseudonocardia sp.]|uniref:serine protease n=1 Tax=Pseudonocardia sp. TaxID=60912 RepID=UPI002ED8827C
MNRPAARHRLPVVAAVLGVVAVGAYLLFGAVLGADRGAAEDLSAQAGVEGASQQSTIPATQAGHRWAPAKTAGITPGVQTYTQGGQCTANFVFVDGAGNVYLGQAAHCASTGKEDQTNGCHAGSRALGTTVTFHRGGSPAGGGDVIGRGQLAYSSWLTMQRSGEKDANTCAYNDFALVKVDAKYVAQVNPGVPFWGGPVDLNTTGTTSGDKVFSYGNSSLRFGLAGLSPQSGASHGDDPAAGGWSHTVTSPTPGIPGDSGSAYLDPDGRALGTLSTLGLSIPAVNNIGDLNRELTYARAHSGIPGLKLVLGTESFDPARLENCLQSSPPVPPLPPGLGPQGPEGPTACTATR